MKSAKLNTQKSIKMFNFNQQWSYRQDHIDKNQIVHQQRKNNTQIRANKTNKKMFKVQNMIYKQPAINVSKLPQILTNKQIVANSQLFPQNKAFSQLQSYKRQIKTNFSSRFSKNNIEKEISSDDSIDKSLIINCKKLKGIKLPTLNSLESQTKIKIKLKNLQIVNLQQRLISNNKQIQKKPSKKFFKQTKIKVRQQQIQKYSNPQEQIIQKPIINNQNFLPTLDIYNKKMNIGKKIKKQQDRIKALLLKTLEKTKATEYIAQRGSSHRNGSKDSSQSSKKSKSKDSRTELSIIEQKSIPKKKVINSSRLQKIKLSLRSGTQKSQQRLFIAEQTNKKFVSMVRQTQNKKILKDQHKLEQITQQITLSKQQTEQKIETQDRQNQQDSQDNQEEIQNIMVQYRNSQNTSQNEFLL